MPSKRSFSASRPSTYFLAGQMRSRKKTTRAIAPMPDAHQADSASPPRSEMLYRAARCLPPVSRHLISSVKTWPGRDAPPLPRAPPCACFSAADGSLHEQLEALCGGSRESINRSSAVMPHRQAGSRGFLLGASAASRYDLRSVHIRLIEVASMLMLLVS